LIKKISSTRRNYGEETNKETNQDFAKEPPYTEYKETQKENESIKEETEDPVFKSGPIKATPSKPFVDREFFVLRNPSSHEEQRILVSIAREMDLELIRKRAQVQIAHKINPIQWLINTGFKERMRQNEIIWGHYGIKRSTDALGQTHGAVPRCTLREIEKIYFPNGPRLFR
jgi:hypothetical protein